MTLHDAAQLISPSHAGIAIFDGMGRRRENFVRVALVLPTEFAYARAVLRGIIAATRERNLYGGDGSAARSAQRRPWLFRVYRGIYGHSSKYLSRWFEQWQPDGIIGQIYDDRLARVYLNTGKPVVELFESRAESQFPRILPDDVATGAMAARHFLERGFRHFAFFGAPWMRWSRERERGYRDEIERAFRSRAELTGKSDDAVEFTFWSYDARPRAMAEVFRARKGRPAGAAAWLASLPKPLALFAANDLWGFELVQVARELGIRVPEELAILGVDNEELLCDIAHPPLSSIRIGAEQIGREAVTLLEKLLTRPRRNPPVPRVPPVEVVTRQSTDVLAVEDPDVAAALACIRERASEGLSVKQLLSAVAVNRRTLERRFVKLLGHTPLEEIRRVRLDRVKSLLQTDLPIYEIARRSGFASSEYLATSFYKATGMTPTEHRRRFAPVSGRQHVPTE